MAQLTEACCTLPPAKFDSNPIGQTEKWGDLPVYTVGDKNSHAAIVAIYDIFGPHNNTLQFVDRLAQAGKFRVVVPDFFRGSPWPESNFPPSDRSQLMSWIQSVGSWEKLQPDLDNVTTQLKQDGFQKIAVIGFCWGAKIALRAGRDGTAFDAIGLLHPSFPADEDFEKLTVPVIDLPSQDEPDMLKFHEKLNPSLKEKSYHQRFDDVAHGWCGSRADWKTEHGTKRATEAYTLLADFFHKTLKA